MNQIKSHNCYFIVIAFVVIDKTDGNLMILKHQNNNRTVPDITITVNIIL